MPGGWTMSMMWMRMPGQSQAAAAVMFLWMWLAMMIAMMLPSVWPMLELYRRTAKFADPSPVGGIMTVVAAGYFAAWLGFGAVAGAAGFALAGAAMHAPQLSQVIPYLQGACLILAGGFQLTALKQSCLRHCQSPLLMLGKMYRPGYRAAWTFGIHHGVFCVACCWALMVMQMVVGTMNPWLMLAVAIAIAAEKLWRHGSVLARYIGGLSILTGAILIAAAVFTERR